MQVLLHHPRFTPEMLGPFLPTWMVVSDQNPRPIKETLNELYSHGGGWHPFEGFTLGDDNSISYPGDPTFSPLATFVFEEEHEGEVACLYESEWVAIIQKDRSFEICRMD